MSGKITDVVVVNITRATITVARRGFGVPLLFSDEAAFTDVRFFTDIDAVGQVIPTNTETYRQAVNLFSQQVKPERIAIAQWNTANSLTDELNALVQKTNGDVWYFLHLVKNAGLVDQDILDAAAWAEPRRKLFLYQSKATGVPGSGSADIASQLKALGYDRSIGYYTVNPQSQIQTLTFNQASVTGNVITGKVNGVTITQNFDTDQATTIAALAAQIQALSEVSTAVVSGGDLVITVTGIANANILLSEWAVTGGVSQPTITVAETQALIIGFANNHIPSAHVGLMAPKNPGSATWKFKNLSGIGADELNDTDRTNLRDKNVNFYEEVAGVSIISSEGVVASGEYIDIMRGTDWIQARIEESVYQTLIDNEKVPYTDKGISAIQNKIEGVLEDAITQGILTSDPAPQVIVPLAAEVDKADKGIRLLDGIEFTGFYAGAVHKVRMSGTLSI
jgi:hypothetical protein